MTVNYMHRRVQGHPGRDLGVELERHATHWATEGWLLVSVVRDPTRSDPFHYVMLYRRIER